MSKESIELLQDLVRCPTGSGQGIGEVLDRVLNRFDGPGWRVHVDGHARFALVAPEAGAELLFACHADTVPFQADDWSHHPLAADLVEDRIIGRGTADMKSGLAAAVSALLAEGPRRAGLLITDEEEVGCLGARAALPTVSDQPVRAVLIPEPTGNRICIGHRGAMTLETSTSGRAAHASAPHLGENAISWLTQVLVRLDQHDPPVADHPLGPFTHAITQIAGGTGRNVVPDRARATVDVRYREGDEADAFLDFVDGLGARAEVVARLAPVHTSVLDPWVQSLIRDATQTGVAPFFTDGSVLGEVGDFPIVIAGPGESSAAHVVDESVAVAQVHEAGVFYRSVIRGWAGAGVGEDGH